jgi:ABC-type transport system involved in multi-copper enzyme maturation permease subunit
MDYLLGRFLALAGLLTAYVVVMSGSLLLTARVVAGYQPGNALRAVGLMVLEVLVLLAVSLLGSSVLPTLTNGVIMLALFGLAWLGGIVGFVGSLPPGNELLANLGTAVGLLLPADAVWRGASYHVLPSSLVVASAFMNRAGTGLPFASTVPMAPAMLAWALAYPVACLGLAVAWFRRRDL